MGHFLQGEFEVCKENCPTDASTATTKGKHYENIIIIIMKCKDGFIRISVQCLTNKGIPCKFPFIYKNKNYNYCAESLLGNFCATEVDKNSKLKSPGICEESCPTTDTSAEDGKEANFVGLNKTFSQHG